MPASSRCWSCKRAWRPISSKSPNRGRRISSRQISSRQISSRQRVARPSWPRWPCHDGRQIALVHADRDAVTLIDTETFEVERTVELARPTGLTDRLLGLLSLAPRTALAKEPAEGSTAWGTYAVDGRFLYVWGMRTGILDDGRAESYSTGLRLVDLSTGA